MFVEFDNLHGRKIFILTHMYDSTDPVVLLSSQLIASGIGQDGEKMIFANNNNEFVHLKGRDKKFEQ